MNIVVAKAYSGLGCLVRLTTAHEHHTKTSLLSWEPDGGRKTACRDIKL